MMSAAARATLALGFLVFADAAWAQSKPAADPPLLFRREYLPKSLLTREKEKLIPLPRQEFEQWLDAAQSRAAQTLPQAWVESIELRAALHGDVLIGQARLAVRRRQAGKNTDPAAIMSLAGLNLPVMDPRWESQKKAAVVGMTAESALVAVIPRSDTLTFDWQVSGRRDAFQASVFDLSLTENSRSTLTLALPADMRLEASAGMIERQSSPNATIEQWSVRFGGSRDVRLRCIPERAVLSKPLILVREENHCTVSPGELETLCQLRLDVYREPVSQIEVELIGDWSPTSIRQGDTQVPFEISADSRRAILRFDPPLSGSNRRLMISGRTTVQLGRRVVAPRVRIKDAAWLDGSLAVEANEVYLQDWELDGLQRASSEASPMAGAQHRWALKSSGAQGAFVVERLPSGVRAETGSTVRLDLDAATASVVADFTADGGGVFELAADVASGWIIDSLETTPSQMLDDWEVVPDEARQHLRVALRHSVSPAQGVRVMIEAHRPAPTPAENVHGNQLRPIRWKVESRGYVALGIDPTWQIEFRGGEQVQRIDPALLTTAQNDRLAIAEDVVLYADDDLFDSARLELSEESPQFTANWQLRVSSNGRRYLQESEARVEPTATPIERMHVLVRPPAGKALQWQVKGDDGPALEARLVRASDGPAGEDEWELTLVRARRNPFTLLATLEVEESASYPARFLRCVEATSQAGRLVLASAPRDRLVIQQATDLERLWNNADAGELAQWSFNAGQAPTLIVRSATAGEQAQLSFVERAELETRVTRLHLLHTVDYTIANQQSQSLVVRLPPRAELDHITVNGRRVDPAATVAEQLTIPLPKQSDAVDLQICFRTLRTNHQAIAVVESAWPETVSPAALRNWRIIFPRRFRQLTWSSSESWTWNNLWRRATAPLPGFETTHLEADTGIPLACGQLTFNSVSGLPATVRLVDGDALAGLSWLLMAICWGAIVIRHSLTARQLVWLVGWIGVVGLCLPACLDPLGRMILLGCVAGLLTRQFRRPALSLARPQRARALSPATTGALCLAASICSLSPAIVGQEGKVTEAVHRVIFPVDDAGKPLDDYVYTSETFYKELFRLAHQPTALGPTAVVLSTECRARPRSDALSWESVDVALTMQVLQPGSVQVSWPREGFVLPPERVRLDGRSVPIAWDPEGAFFTLGIEDAGGHILQFVAQPTNKEDAQCPLVLPPAATARLLLDTLDDAAQVHAWPGPVTPTLTRDDGVQIIELGQRREVTLDTRPIDSAVMQTEAEQLLWANLWRGGGVVEGRWRFQASSGLLMEAVVDVGDGLELLSAAALTPAGVQWHPEEGLSRMVWTPRTPTDELVVEAVFHWHDPAVQRMLPRVEPRNANVVRRWLAVDPHGNTGVIMPAAEDKVDVGEFAALWNAETWPDTARSLAKPGPVLLGVLTDAERLSYDATTSCRVSAKSTSFQFQAHIKGSDRPVSLIRIAVPQGATIHSVDVGVAGQFRTVPWLPLAGNQIALLPAEPVRSGQLVLVRGELPQQQSETVFAPLRIASGQELSHVVNLARHSDVQIKLTAHEGFHVVEPRDDLSGSISVARLELDEPSPASRQLRWNVQPNQPRLVGILVTTMRPEGQQWIARLDAFLAVRDGVVDAFHLESSGAWNAPRLVTGDATLQVRDSSGGVKHIALKLRGPPDSRYHLALEGIVPAQGIQTPVFRLLGAENIQQYVRLPESNAWSTAGLQQASLPAVAANMSGSNDMSVYRAAVPQFRVELLHNKTVVSNPRIAWGAVQISTHADGRYIAVTEVAIEPSGVAALPVSLPSGALLVQATVEDEAAVASLKGQRRFEVPLRSSTLPQTVRIVYAGERTPGDDLSTLVPRFDSWKEDNLVVATANEEIAPPPLSQIIPLLTDALLEPPQPDDELASWASRWLFRLQTAQAFDHSASESEVQQADLLLERLRLMLDTETMFDELLPGSAAPTIDLPPPTPSQQHPGPWLAVMVAWLGVVTGGYRASQSTLLQELGRRWPSAAAALIALGTAVLVSPWIGGALLAVAAGSSLTWPWQKAAS